MTQKQAIPITDEEMEQYPGEEIKLPTPKYGWYSAQAIERGMGSNFYSTPDGGEVEITAVSCSRSDTTYLWPDRVFVGEVVEWMRRGKPATYSILRAGTSWIWGEWA